MWPMRDQFWERAAVASNGSARHTLMRIACKTVVALAVAAMLPACSNGSPNNPFTSELLGESVEQPFFLTATARMEKRLADPSTAKTELGEFRRRTSQGVTLAYSGRPDGVSLDEIYHRRGLVRAPRAQRYLQRVMNKLLQAWPYRVPRLGIFVVNSDGFDAHATAGGDILISRGLLSIIRSEDELAAVLAHELGHIAMFHHERAEQVADQKRTLNAATNIAVQALVWTNTSWTKTGKNSYRGNLNVGQFASQSLQAGGACLAATYLVDKLVDPGWSRQQENEADLFGIDLMIKAGYNAGGAVKAMRRRIKFEGDKHKSIINRRHERGDYDQIVSKNVKQRGPVAGLIFGVGQGIAAGVIDTMTEVDAAISRTHELSKDRLASMQKYLRRMHANRPRVPERVATYKAEIHAGPTARIFANLRAATEADVQFSGGKLDAALKALRKALSPPTHRHVVPRMVAYRIMSGTGKHEEAFHHLLKVRDTRDAPPQYFSLLADGYARRGQMKKAEAAYEKMRSRRESIFDRQEKKKGSHWLNELLFRQPKDGANRFRVNGFCEDLKKTTNKTLSSISGRKI